MVGTHQQICAGNSCSNAMPPDNEVFPTNGLWRVQNVLWRPTLLPLYNGDWPRKQSGAATIDSVKHSASQCVQTAKPRSNDTRPDHSQDDTLNGGAIFRQHQSIHMAGVPSGSRRLMVSGAVGVGAVELPVERNRRGLETQDMFLVPIGL
jgi:hypothetical protein